MSSDFLSVIHPGERKGREKDGSKQVYPVLPVRDTVLIPACRAALDGGPGKFHPVGAVTRGREDHHRRRSAGSAHGHSAAIRFVRSRNLGDGT